MSAAAPIHAATAQRWPTYTLVEQLAHVGSEVERAIRAFEAGKPDRFDFALARALELFDFTAADARWRGSRCREILRAREEFCRLFFDEAVAPDSAAGLRRYFLMFAVAARRQRDNPSAGVEASGA
jgi:hypothetical protein